MNIWTDEWDADEDWSGGGSKSRRLEEGEVVHFPPGPDGAHGLRNDTDEPARYVVAGTRVSPEVVEYPDLKQVTAQSRQPTTSGGPLFVIHDMEEEA
jgi:uncharacterized cupin superfamily protein